MGNPAFVYTSYIDTAPEQLWQPLIDHEFAAAKPASRCPADPRAAARGARAGRRCLKMRGWLGIARRESR